MLEIRGGDNLAGIAKAVRATGDKQLQKDMNKGINKAVVPLRRAVKTAWSSDLPQRGGLADFVASTPIRTQKKYTGKNAGVRLVARKKGHDLAAINRGRVRHPVWGNRAVWVIQGVKANIWQDTLDANSGIVRKNLLEVLDDITRRISG